MGNIVGWRQPHQTTALGEAMREVAGEHCRGLDNDKVRPRFIPMWPRESLGVFQALALDESVAVAVALGIIFACREGPGCG